MDTGTVLAEIHNLAQIPVEAGFLRQSPEERSVGARRTSGHQDAIQLLIGYQLFKGGQPVRGTPEGTGADVRDMRIRLRAVDEVVQIDRVRDFAGALAEEYADSRMF
jgi:hypothetical protein